MRTFRVPLQYFALSLRLRCRSAGLLTKHHCRHWRVDAANVQSVFGCACIFLQLGMKTLKSDCVAADRSGRALSCSKFVSIVKRSPSNSLRSSTSSLALTLLLVYRTYQKILMCVATTALFSAAAAALMGRFERDKLYRLATTLSEVT